RSSPSTCPTSSAAVCPTLACPAARDATASSSASASELTLFGGWASRRVPAAIVRTPAQSVRIRRLTQETPMDDVAPAASTKLHTRPPIPVAERKRFYGNPVPLEGE